MPYQPFPQLQSLLRSEDLKCLLPSTTNAITIVVTQETTLTSILRPVAQGDHLRHSHWRGLDPLPSWQHRLIGVYMILLALTAVMGNILVIWACVRRKIIIIILILLFTHHPSPIIHAVCDRYRSLRTSSNLLVVNLAVGDLLMCAVDFPLFVTASFLQNWPFGKIVCQTYGMLTGTAGLVTINTLAVISLDRYHAVSNHLHPAQPRPTRATVTAAVGVWLYSLPWAMAPVFGWGDYVLDGVGTTCTFDFLTKSLNNLSFVMAITVGNFFLPLTVIVFSYTGIWLVVRSTHVSLRRQGETTVSIGTQRHRLGMQSDLKTASIILMIVATFFSPGPRTSSSAAWGSSGTDRT
ncbi:rhodopsin-like [Babylonia areolata]|uniref:rhodopsin-like n=1 Tax=Babylonia areolata TaxID=304850 RepID=UPI003FD35664